MMGGKSADAELDRAPGVFSVSILQDFLCLPVPHVMLSCLKYRPLTTTAICGSS
jgi:hypothetical protein